MNILDEIKLYQSQRRESTDRKNDLVKAATSFYQQISSVNTFVRNLPMPLMFRKRRLQQSAASIVKIVDSMVDDFSKLDIDCSLQIQQLISAQQLEKLREEHANAHRTNPVMVRRSNFKRK
jgi:uncharacterized membrane protein YgaE (UPF0421/DUF939 family)